MTRRTDKNETLFKCIDENIVGATCQGINLRDNFYTKLVSVICFAISLFKLLKFSDDCTRWPGDLAVSTRPCLPTYPPTFSTMAATMGRGIADSPSLKPTNGVS